MKVSTKGRYALRVMVDLAMYDNGEYISLKDIASRQDISIKYLEQIMRLLTTAGLVRSARGANGGYRLVKKSNEYTVKDILQVSEGNLALVECVESDTYCGRCSDCATRSLWKGLNEQIDKYLASFTIQDLVDNNSNFDYII